MTCNNCTWFVDEEIPGDYSHETAKRLQKGFCLLKDLFTMQKPDDEACSDFNFDGENENGKNDD